MIDVEKALQKKAARYASGVSSAVNGKRFMEWKEITDLIEAAYFNGFQSGACWREGEVEKQVTRYKVINRSGETLKTFKTEKAANRYRDQTIRRLSASHHVIPYKAVAKIFVVFVPVRER